MADKFIDGHLTFRDLRAAILAVLYKVGAIGLKPHVNEPVYFSYLSSYTVRPEDVGDDMRISVCPMLWRALSLVRGRLKGEPVI